MKTREFYGKDISGLGFGLMRLPREPEKPASIDYAASERLIDHAIANGVNYFDTAYTYAGSEEFVGYALSKYPRDSYCLATKCPPWMVKNASDFESVFAEQQARCKTGYFDFYLVHNLAREKTRAAGNEAYFENFEKIGMYDMLKKKKAGGKIRHIGFSFHGTPALFQKMIDRYEWDFVYIQLNYIDWTATEARLQYEMLAERGIPAVVMEPLRGGALTELDDEAAAILTGARPDSSLASWGIRYAASLNGVLTVLSGMNAMQQLEDNITTLSNFEPVTAEEKELLEKAAVAYNSTGAIGCTGCGYCMPCPQGVDIPRVFSIYNHGLRRNYRIPFDNGYSTLDEREKAASCTRCGACAEKCPQYLDIPGHLQEIDAYAKDM